MSIDSGADELGLARNAIAQLLEFAVAYDVRPKRDKGQENNFLVVQHLDLGPQPE